MNNLYRVTEHTLYPTPRPTTRIVEAISPVKAIQSLNRWKNASHFTTMDGGLSVYTQNGSGHNGCKAEPVKLDIEV